MLGAHPTPNQKAEALPGSAQISPAPLLGSALPPTPDLPQNKVKLIIFMISLKHLLKKKPWFAVHHDWHSP